MSTPDVSTPGKTTRPAPLPTINGLAPSYKHLPAKGPWATMFDYLVEAFPRVPAEVLLARMVKGDVVDEQGVAIRPDTPFRPRACLYYYREVPDEPQIPFTEAIVHQDAHLLVADKPHFLPVIPAGRFLNETLLIRLRRRTGIDTLVPLHRLDRETAGLMLFSVNPDTRAAYATLFPERRVEKVYEAVADVRPELAFPRIHRSRLGTAEPFFRRGEIEGTPNSETEMALLSSWRRADGQLCGHYRLKPLTGRQHQLRVHMAALGLGLHNDRLYPELRDDLPEDYAKPLQLLARRLRFFDPLSGEAREFESRLQLSEVPENVRNFSAG